MKCCDAYIAETDECNENGTFILRRETGVQNIATNTYLTAGEIDNAPIWLIQTKIFHIRRIFLLLIALYTMMSFHLLKDLVYRLRMFHKKDEDWRYCQAYRLFGKITALDLYPVAFPIMRRIEMLGNYVLPPYYVKNASSGQQYCKAVANKGKLYSTYTHITEREDYSSRLGVLGNHPVSLSVEIR
uniref:Uncharacterized protein n=1 Tax=Glossina brevipalpis TaxID=37001 RepID=A0A1A9W0F2_9MUSC